MNWSSVLYTFIVSFNISFLLADTYVERITRRATCNYSIDPFCSSNDLFSNPAKTVVFCRNKTAKCVDDCKKCECEKDLSFLSYKHGCVNGSVLRNLFQAPTCFTNGYQQTKIYAIHDKTFAGKQCHELYYNGKSSDKSFIENCFINELYTINVLSNERENVTDSLLEFYNDFGLFTCLMTIGNASFPTRKYAGKLFYVKIDCGKSTNNNVFINTCFMFKVDGTSYSSDSYPVPTKTVPDENKLGGSNSASIIAIVISIILLVIVLLIILFVCYRRRRQARKKTHLNKNSDGEELVTMNDTQLYEDITPKDEMDKKHNQTYEYAYIAASNDGKDTKDGKEGDNIYYQATDETLKDNSVKEVISPVYKEVDNHNDSVENNVYYAPNDIKTLNSDTPPPMYTTLDDNDTPPTVQDNVYYKPSNNIEINKSVDTKPPVYASLDDNNISDKVQDNVYYQPTNEQDTNNSLNTKSPIYTTPDDEIEPMVQETDGFISNKSNDVSSNEDVTSEQENIVKKNPVEGYAKVNKEKNVEPLQMNTRKAGYDDVGSIIPNEGTDDKNIKDGSAYEEVDSVMPVNRLVGQHDDNTYSQVEIVNP